MKKALLLNFVVICMLVGCGGGPPDRSTGMRVTLVTRNTSAASVSNVLTAHAVVPGTTTKFFGIARNGYVIMYNEFQITSLRFDGTEVLSETSDGDYTWYITATPSQPSCNIELGHGIIRPYDPDTPGKYRIRVDFHDLDGIYQDLSFEGIAVYYGGIWFTNPLMENTDSLICSQGYSFNPDGTLTPVSNKDAADLYLGDQNSLDQNYLLAKNGITKLDWNYEQIANYLTFNPDSYTYQPRLNVQLIPSQSVQDSPFGIYLVKCQNGYAKFVVSSIYDPADQLTGWYDFTTTNEFTNFD